MSKSKPLSTHALRELEELEALIGRANGALRSEVVCRVDYRGRQWPVHCLELGSRDPLAPVVGFFGGIHGVERIGTQVLLAFLHTLVERLRWDEELERSLQHVRLVFMPLINPGGMLAETRANPAGVDLMRNAPMDAEDAVPLLGGHRLTPMLPWFRGRAGEAMQPEAAAMCRVVEERLLTQPFSLALDCHSGFGVRDQIWFPYARTTRPIDCLGDLYALRSLFRATHPHHNIYVIEPQARHYTTHGDLWDYLYDRPRAQPGQVFLPLTLEMGSWMWLKKNPRQMFRLLGIFNPVLPHRLQRTLRRHMTLFEFLLRAAVSHQRWLPQGEQRQLLNQAAIDYWPSILRYEDQ
ncbi:zinc carboxypeptidase [Solimonas sp. K1W22B-7]|uniref:M14 family zinc carboxypeptidase n=1 Tax=Solimonas sp. K1W22B-7 TaxID=2303331 RepID=UPI000E32E9CA|nr:M14 family zinc carboxypeptidase [Solimonas sp. K1W22B-7]AXQ30850.1 zinc carboxypeptidase [Solimonas sp. K1W22B-7]